MTSGLSDVDVAGQRELISFAEKFTRSQQFEALFREGMALVEEAADYLDAEGRKQSQQLAPPLSVIYATESMRMTTRLLEVASWLVVQRALKDGEMTAEEAAAKRAKVRLQTMPAPETIARFDELPVGLRSLIERSGSMIERLRQLDQAMYPKTSSLARFANPVGGQLKRLAAAFSANG